MRRVLALIALLSAPGALAQEDPMLGLRSGERVERYSVDDAGECLAIIRSGEKLRAALIPCELIPQEAV